jgi:hypothetical protein
MTIAVVCTVLLGVLIFGLGFAVSIARGRAGLFHGFDSDPTSSFYKLFRAHGNATEYVPMLAVLILYLGSTQPPPWVQGLMVAAVVFRYLQAAGVAWAPTLGRVTPVRLIGALGTYLSGLLLCAAAALSVISR